MILGSAARETLGAPVLNSQPPVSISIGLKKIHIDFGQTDQKIRGKYLKVAENQEGFKPLFSELLHLFPPKSESELQHGEDRRHRNSQTRFSFLISARVKRKRLSRQLEVSLSQGHT